MSLRTHQAEERQYRALSDAESRQTTTETEVAPRGIVVDSTPLAAAASHAQSDALDVGVRNLHDGIGAQTGHEAASIGAFHRSMTAQPAHGFGAQAIGSMHGALRAGGAAPTPFTQAALCHSASPRQLVQMKRQASNLGGAITARKDDEVRALAAQGVQGNGAALPHRERFEAALPGVDLSSVRLHVGGQAGQSATGMGAEAYASGEDIAFQSQPDLHTLAHEVAHVVQQRHGVALSGGVGAQGDSYEQQADAFADALVAGRSTPVIAAGPNAATTSKTTDGAVQRKEAATVQPEQASVTEQDESAMTSNEISKAAAHMASAALDLMIAWDEEIYRLESDLNCFTRRAVQLFTSIKGRPRIHQWMPSIMEAKLEAQNNPSEESLKALASLVKSGIERYDSYLGNMSEGAETAETSRKAIVIISAVVSMGSGAYVTAMAKGATWGVVALRTGAAAMAAYDAAETVTDLQEAYVKWNVEAPTNLMSLCLQTLQSMRAGSALNTPGWSAEVPVRVKLRLLGNKKRSIDIHLTGLVGLVRSDNMEWEASIDVAVAIGGQLSTKDESEVAGLAGMGASALAAHPDISVAIADVAQQANAHLHFNAFDTSDSGKGSQDAADTTDTPDTPATQVSSTGYQVGADLNLAAPDLPGFSADAAYKTINRDISVGETEMPQTTVNKEWSVAVSKDSTTMVAPSGEKGEKSAAISASFATQHLEGDLCLDNNGDYFSISLSWQSGTDWTKTLEDAKASTKSSLSTSITKLGRNAPDFVTQILSRAKELAQTFEEAETKYSKLDTTVGVAIQMVWEGSSYKTMYVRPFLEVGASIKRTAENEQSSAGGVGLARRAAGAISMHGDNDEVAHASASATIPLTEIIGANTTSYMKQRFMRNTVGGVYERGGALIQRPWWTSFLVLHKDQLQQLFINVTCSSEQARAALRNMRAKDSSAFNAKYLAWIVRKEREFYSEVKARQNTDAWQWVAAISALANEGDQREAKNQYREVPQNLQDDVDTLLGGLNRGWVPNLLATRER